MTNITCTLDCEHEIDWGDNPHTPGADLPYRGRIVYCPECEADKEITDCNPGSIKLRDVVLSEKAPVFASRQPSPGDMAAIMWDTHNNSFAYCLHGISREGLAYESEDSWGYTSADEAEAEARGEYAEQMNEVNN